MDVICSPGDLIARVRAHRRDGLTIGFVPTMGALHDGHLSLIDIARSNVDLVIVSAFVNPLQFDDPGDFERYPQTQSSDEQMCAERGVDILFRPSPASMYPQGFSTTIHVG